jgi:cytochrome c biogenesis protein CcmG/thiol:disulfide interchange protein DsbE
MTSISRSVWIALEGVALSLVACAAGSEGGRGAESAEDPAGLVGNPAPDFSVKPVSGSKGTVSLKGLHGNVVLVDFWGTFCEPCKKSFPKLQDLYAKFSGQGLQVVGVSEDEVDDKGKIPTFATTYGAKFAIAWDEDKAIARRYKPDTMPSTFLIDRRGIVRFAHAGYHDGEEVQIQKEIEELLGR